MYFIRPSNIVFIQMYFLRPWNIVYIHMYFLRPWNIVYIHIVLYTTLKYCLHPKCTLYDPQILFTSKCTLGQEKKYKKLHVFPLTCSIEILGSVGRKKILFLRIFLASFYRGHILTFNSACSKMAKKTLG